VQGAAFFALIGVVFAATFEPEAHAGAPPASKGKLAILTAVTAGAHGSTTPAAVYERLAAAIRFRPELELIPYNDLLIDGDDSLATSVRDCGSDIACITFQLKNASVAFGLRIAVNFELDPPLVSMLLIDTAKRAVTAEAIGEAKVELPAVLEQLAKKLLDDAGFVAAGLVFVNVDPAGAEISIPTAHLRELGPPPVFVALPGVHEARAKSADHLDGTARVLVREGLEHQVHLVLEEEPRFLGSALFWGVIVAAVVGGTVATLIATDPFSRDVGCICIVRPDGTCANQCPD
jgi:hypothetical protein